MAWQRIAREFVIDGLHLNTGTYGACPLPVLDATFQHMRAFERIVGQEGFDVPAFKQELETFIGAWPGSVAVLRNTTEAMNIAAAGLELQPGDEVLSTTHEHIGGRCCWELLAKRRGITYRTFAPPLDPASDAELVAAWQEEVTPRTRVLSISHVLFSTGLLQPVAELVRWARARDAIVRCARRAAAHHAGVAASRGVSDRACIVHNGRHHRRKAARISRRGADQDATDRRVRLRVSPAEYAHVCIAEGYRAGGGVVEGVALSCAQDDHFDPVMQCRRTGQISHRITRAVHTSAPNSISA